MSGKEIKQIVVFRLKDESTKQKERFGVPIEQVQEIRVLESITKIPKAPSYVKGITNLRGSIITIIDLKEMLGIPSNQYDVKQHILVTDIKGTKTGLLVDEIDHVVRISQKNISPAPKGMDTNRYVDGIAKIDENLVLLINLNTLLNVELKTMQTMASEEISK